MDGGSINGHFRENSSTAIAEGVFKATASDKGWMKGRLHLLRGYRKAMFVHKAVELTAIYQSVCLFSQRP
jgi:hypothetical protein